MNVQNPPSFPLLTLCTMCFCICLSLQRVRCERAESARRHSAAPGSVPRLQGHRAGTDRSLGRPLPQERTEQDPASGSTVSTALGHCRCSAEIHGVPRLDMQWEANLPLDRYEWEMWIPYVRYAVGGKLPLDRYVLERWIPWVRYVVGERVEVELLRKYEWNGSCL